MVDAAAKDNGFDEESLPAIPKLKFLILPKGNILRDFSNRPRIFTNARRSGRNFEYTAPRCARCSAGVRGWLAAQIAQS
jgi:hypothetical protein